jgi:hypothetical protein
MKQFLFLFGIIFSSIVASWGQTTVCYSFTGGSTSGTLDPNIGFTAYQNGAGTAPGIFSNQLRLYQNSTKGGSIRINASNGAIITNVTMVTASSGDGDGPAGYSVDNTTEAGTFGAGGGTLTMSGLSASSYVEFYNKGNSSSTRTYVISFCVTYYIPSACAQTITSFTPANGPVGTEMIITGTGFTSGASVKIGGVTAATTFVNATTLRVIVPAGAETGAVSVTQSACEVTGNDFTVNTTTGACGGSGGDYEILIWNGGDEDWSSPNFYVSLSGTIPNNTAWVIGCGTGASSGTGNPASNTIPYGFNRDERIVLYKNGTQLDRFGTTGNSNWMTEGRNYSRNANVTTPSATYTAGQWTNVAYTTSSLGTHTFTNPLSDIVISEVADPTSGNDHYIEIYNGTGAPINLENMVSTTPVVTTQPVNSNSCVASFNVAASPGNGGSLTYRWYYQNNSGGAWTAVSATSPANLSISGFNTNSLTVAAGTAATSTIDNYQFYCLVTENGTCSVYSNAAQFHFGAKRYYRSNVTTGNWNVTSTWQMADGTAGPWSTACDYPTDVNSDYISIQPNHTITFNVALAIDEVIIQNGGHLILAAKPTLSNGTGIDLTVNGTLTDNLTTASQITWGTGSRWQLGNNATIIKTNSSSVANYRDNYQGGISTIPATAHWIYRQTAANTITTAIANMYYPNLYFENATGTAYNWSGTTTAFTGTANTGIVKGNLYVGWTSSGAGVVTINNDNTAPSQIIVNKNVYIKTGSAVTGIGTGWDIKGDSIFVNGSFTPTSMGTITFSGTNMQHLYSSATGDFTSPNVKLNNANGLMVRGIDATVTNELEFITGIIHTDITATDKVNITNSATTAIIGGQAQSAFNRYIDGKLQWLTATGSTYVFPVGSNKVTYGAQGFNFTVDGGNGAVLAYLEMNTSAPILDYAYCDLETHPGAGTVNVGNGNPGYDGILDQVNFNLRSQLQWHITNPSGAITQYDITVLATGNQNINPVVSANGEAIRYLMKNGQPGNPNVSTITATGFSDSGFDMCPNQYTLEDLTSFSLFTLDGATQSGTVLPIEMVSFTGVAVHPNSAQLNWVTASELNNDYFTLFHSTDGFTFEPLAEIDGAGTSKSILNYTYRHNHLSKGVHYYRLFSTDFDGTVYNRGTVAVEIDLNQIYYNPITTSIELSSAGNVKIYSTEGKLVAEGNGINSIPFHHRGLFLIYFVDTEKTERIVIR